MLASDVFKAGGLPGVTYNPRKERGLEDQLDEYLSQFGKAMFISGPTKSGKTVLVQQVLPTSRAIWIQGSDLQTVDSFWTALVDRFQGFDQIQVSEQYTEGGSGSLTGGLGVPKVAHVERTGSTSSSAMTSTVRTRKRSPQDVAREFLVTNPKAIVIDDFHFVPTAIRRAIAQAIKTIIPTTHVLLIAVPYEAFDVVRQEPDLGGRVWHVKVDPWTVDELEYIGQRGFAALNLRDSAAVTSRLADNSFGAPFVMQQMCHDLCYKNEIRSSVALRQTVMPPSDWEAFFRILAKRQEPSIFSMLSKGKKERGQRRKIRIIGEDQTDTYGLILHGLKAAGPKSETSLAELGRCISGITDTPGNQQISFTLSKMSEIAEANRGSGDPALVFRNDQVYIQDPFLLFHLKYGDWDTL